ncbi:MAG: enoyl-CoA hydratase/isomerase family protein [Bacillota bacterium]
MGNQDLLFEKADGVATITLNRPERRNAFSQDMIRMWVDALEEARDDNEIKVVVLTGAGDAFCSGGDVKAMAEGRGFFEGDQPGSSGVPIALERKNNLWRLIHRVPLTLQDLDKPVIASVNGAATGAGCDMALMCDLRIASEKARFGETYVNVGLVPGDGGAYFLPRLIGLPRALELLWTGRMIDAWEAEKIGLVNRVVPVDQLKEATMELAGKIARGPSIAIRMIKRAVYQGLTSDLRTSLDMISSHMAIVLESEDHQEGVRSFVEKRPPQFKGR